MGHADSQLFKKFDEIKSASKPQLQNSIFNFIADRDIFMVTGSFMFAHVSNQFIDDFFQWSLGNILDFLFGIDHRKDPTNATSEFIVALSSLCKVVLVFGIVYAIYRSRQYYTYLHKVEKFLKAKP